MQLVNYIYHYGPKKINRHLITTDNTRITLIYTDPINTTFFKCSSFRTAADKQQVSLNTLLENWVQEDKSYLVESACEIDNNLPSSVIVNYLKFANVTYKRSAERQIKHIILSYINTTQLTTSYKTSSSILIYFWSESTLTQQQPQKPRMRTNAPDLPCFIITVRNRTMTLEHGLMRTWRFPRFSALLMLLRASARTFMRTMVPAGDRGGGYTHRLLGTEILSTPLFFKANFRLQRPQTDSKWYEIITSFLRLKSESNLMLRYAQKDSQLSWQVRKSDTLI